MNGLYFYKLVSPYPEDITKDCKLTVNEIDHNFITLKKSDIEDFYMDQDKRFIVLETKGGDVFKADVSNFAKDVSVKYDKALGIIEIHHDGIVDVIDDLVTKDNISAEIAVNVITDATLKGNGGSNNPIGLTCVEKTSSYKSVIKVIDKTKGFTLPSFEHNVKGDRYLTYEYLNEYGYLYNYPSVVKFVKDINCDWRIPTKSDWDDMLNSIELCDSDRNHDVTSCNNILGKIAGKLLKSKDGWVNGDYCHDHDCGCHDHDCGCHDHDCGCHDEYFDDDLTTDTCCHPHHKCVTPTGVDSYGMRILPSGYGDGGMMLDYFGRRAKFWTSTEIQVTNMYVKRFDYDKAGVVQIADNPRSIASVRLVKDYDGSNFKDIECIGGVNYKCVLMPAKKASHGHLIWMASNLSASQKRYCPVSPNNGDTSDTKKVFYINEWDGFDWVRKQMMEGDSLSIEFGPDSERNNEYRLVNGVLINVKKDIISTVENKYDDAIDDLKARLDVAESDINDIKDNIADINDKLAANDVAHQEIIDRLDEEQRSREEVDTQMWEAINNEITSRTDADKQMWDAINSEITNREEVDTQMWEAINNEITNREEVDKQMWDAINSEITSREEVDTQMWEAINNEITSRTDADTQMWEAINNEITSREEVDTQMWGAINNEIERSTTEDKRLLAKEGSNFDCANGLLTLVADDENNNISIKWDSNYGTF